MSSQDVYKEMYEAAQVLLDRDAGSQEKEQALQILSGRAEEVISQEKAQETEEQNICSPQQLGFGVLINMLSGNQDTVDRVTAAIGKVIATVSVDKEADELVFEFTDRSKLTLFDGGQSCCEHRYMSTDDPLAYFKGSTLMNIEVKDGGSKETDSWGECLDSQFLIVTTSYGEFTVVNYNEHNGYYGGFYIKAR